MCGGPQAEAVAHPEPAERERADFEEAAAISPAATNG